jgi:hypothetical protein
MKNKNEKVPVLPPLRTDRKEHTDGLFDRVPRITRKAGWNFKMVMDMDREVRGYVWPNFGIQWLVGVLQSDAQFAAFIEDFIQENGNA